MLGTLIQRCQGKWARARATQLHGGLAGSGLRACCMSMLMAVQPLLYWDHKAQRAELLPSYLGFQGHGPFCGYFFFPSPLPPYLIFETGSHNIALAGLDLMHRPGYI